MYAAALVGTRPGVTKQDPLLVNKPVAIKKNWQKKVNNNTFFLLCLYSSAKWQRDYVRIVSESWALTLNKETPEKGAVKSGLLGPKKEDPSFKGEKQIKKKIEKKKKVCGTNNRSSREASGLPFFFFFFFLFGGGPAGP